MPAPGLWLASILVTFLILIRISTQLKCPGIGSIEYVTGTCIYTVSTRFLDYEASVSRCQSLNEDSHVWYLPKLDTRKKHGELAASLLSLDKSNSNGWILWLGLMRSEATTQEATDSNGWKDKKKWLWKVDKSGLVDNSFWKVGEPDSSNDPNKRCVVVFLSKTGNVQYWISAKCRWPIPNGSANDFVNGSAFILACESSVDQSTVTSSTSVLPSSFQWQWLLLASCIILLLVSLAVLAAVLCAKKKYEKIDRHGKKYLNKNPYLKKAYLKKKVYLKKARRSGKVSGASSMVSTEGTTSSAASVDATNCNTYENVEAYQEVSTDQTTEESVYGRGRKRL